MSDFEKAYYEAESFWAGEAIQDEANLLRFRETAALIPDDAGSLADIGCGNGLFVHYLQQQRPGLELMAVDRSEAALRFVKTNKQLGDIVSVPLPDKSYDCVTCLEVIEHLPVTVFPQALKELSRLSRKYMIISVPYAEALEENHTQCPQCKSIFNADLHLRNFSETSMQQLLLENGFECVSTKKAGARQFYKGHLKFRKIFYPSQFRAWRSPICPICGFQSVAEPVAKTHVPAAATTAPAPAAGRSLLSYITPLPKMLWPKETKYYWIIALYKRR